MPFVLDASVAGNWFFPDEPPRALNAWARIRTDLALVPQHWWFELHNVLLIAERRERLSQQQATNILAHMLRLRITPMQRPKGGVILSLARYHGLTFYDAAYLELALRERVALATLDRRLGAAAGKEGVALIAGSTD